DAAERGLRGGPASRFLAARRGRRAGRLLDRFERVAGRAHGTDRIAPVVERDRLAQPANVHVDRALLDLAVRPPHRIEQLAAREHAARMLHEELEQAILGRADPQRSTAALDPVGYRIEPQIARLE